MTIKNRFHCYCFFAVFGSKTIKNRFFPIRCDTTLARWKDFSLRLPQLLNTFEVTDTIMHIENSTAGLTCNSRNSRRIGDKISGTFKFSRVPCHLLLKF